MGLGDLVSSWGSSIGNAWGRITAGVSHIVDEVKHTGQQALDTAKSAVVTVYHDAKDAITGYGKADKKQVQQNVKVLCGLEEIPKPDDAADAMAIAIATQILVSRNIG